MFNQDIGMKYKILNSAMLIVNKDISERKNGIELYSTGK